MQASHEAQIYFNHPPDHLILDGADGVRWSDHPDVPNDTATLLDSIKTARNNLFHGDKAHDSRRDTELMAAALFILNAAYEDAERTPGFEQFIAAMEYGL